MFGHMEHRERLAQICAFWRRLDEDRRRQPGGDFSIIPRQPPFAARRHAVMGIFDHKVSKHGPSHAATDRRLDECVCHMLGEKWPFDREFGMRQGHVGRLERGQRMSVQSRPVDHGFWPCVAFQIAAVAWVDSVILSAS